MPSTSKKQHDFMAAIANNPKFAKQAGVPQSVGKDFTEADKGIKFGGKKPSVERADLQKANKPDTRHGESQLFKQGGLMKKPIMAIKKMAKGGDTSMSNSSRERRGMTEESMGGVRTAAPSKDGIAERGKTRGTEIKMAGNSIGTGPASMKKGGMAMKMKK
jgi:hypothetical protein